ncbi:lipoteichoic acid stability factor AuxB [Staphylococcus cohnii]
MSGEQYTQVRRPVSRLAEKVLGWLNWIFLLLLTIITMFIALVSFSSESSIQDLETSLNGNDFIQQILANNGLNTIQFVIWLQNGIWAVIVYFIVCLLISFLALISMNIRILSGFLFLIATIVTLPLVLLFVPLIIPILFLIVAIMMFARKDKVEMIPAYYSGGYQGSYNDYGQERESEPKSEPRSEPKSEPNPQYNVQQDTSDLEQPSNQEQQLRRGVYSSEIADKVNSDINSKEEEPQVLSRQAKYNYKSRKQSNDIDDNLQNEQEDANIDSEESEIEARQRQEAFEKEQQLQQEAYEEQQRIKQEKAEEAARLKQEKAEEKARIKQEKKARKQREKERRKQQPSAVSQRRMNFEERKKITGQSAESSEIDEAKSQSSKTKQNEAIDSDKEK